MFPQTNKCPHTVKPRWRKMHSTESLCEVSPLKSGNGSIWHLLKNIYSYYSNSTRKVSPNKLLLSEYYLNAPVCDLHKFFLCFPDKKSQHNRHNSQEDNGWFCLCLKACQIQKKTNNCRRSLCLPTDSLPSLCVFLLTLTLIMLHSH